MKHNNINIAEDAMRIFNTKSFDNISSEVNPVIQPTIEIRRYANFCRNSQASTSGNVTVSVPSDKDFYLTGVTMSFIKDVTCDSATGAYTFQANIEGVARAICAFSIITLTAQNDSLSAEFYTPIKIDRGTSLTLTGTFTAGACRRDLQIRGYTVETTKGT